MDMRENHLGYRETARKYLCETGQESIYKNRIIEWERKYLEEGEAGFYIQKCGRSRKMETKPGRPRKKPLEQTVENELIAENQRLKEQVEWLQMENDYLKKLDALVRRDEQLYGKKRKP